MAAATIEAAWRARVRELDLATRRVVDEIFVGRYQSAFKGQGIEFADVREYAFGDDVRAIDWKVTARAGRLHVRRYLEERGLTVLLLADRSASLDFGTGRRTKRELAAEVAGLIAFAAHASRDRVGLLTYAGGDRLFVPPTRGATHLLRMIGEILRPAEAAGTRGDLAAALGHASAMLRKSALVLVISDFLATGYEPYLTALARRHDVVAVRVFDAAERPWSGAAGLPAVGLVRLLDPETGEVVIVDTSDPTTRRAAAQRLTGLEAATRSGVRRMGLQLVEISTTDDVAMILGRFFRGRGRQRPGPARP